MLEQHFDADHVVILHEECALVCAKWRNDERAAGSEVKAGLDGGVWDVSSVPTAPATLSKTSSSRRNYFTVISSVCFKGMRNPFDL